MVYEFALKARAFLSGLLFQARAKKEIMIKD
jgi:hypothetical protein